jgi:hypothetical protein
MIRLCLALLALTAVTADAREPRSRAWLENYVRQSVSAGARDARYLTLINRSLDESWLGLDLAALDNGGPNISRAQTNTLGRLAFCYRTPGLRYYRDPQLLEKLRLGYLAAARHIGPDGFIKWPGDADYYWEAHEQSWRLEPLLIGFIWVGAEFPSADRDVIAAALARSAGWIAGHPYNQTNNRGAVWCAIATLCGVYFERPDYLRTVEKYAGPILDGVLWPDGEAGEHTAQYGSGGPDSNYSYTGWAYVYLYRLFSGRDELDPKLRNAMRWFAVYNSFRGFPLVTGASVRRTMANPANLQDLLPSLERFSREDPFWARLAGNVLEKKEKYLPEFGGHLISPPDLLQEAARQYAGGQREQADTEQHHHHAEEPAERSHWDDRELARHHQHRPPHRLRQRGEHDRLRVVFRQVHESGYKGGEDGDHGERGDELSSTAADYVVEHVDALGVATQLDDTE